MSLNLRGKHFLKLLDFSSEEIRYLLDLSKNFKDMKRAGVPHRYLEGKNVALIFEKTSTRTRCAFEVGAKDLGMGVTYLDPTGSQMGHKESIADTARVLGRMFDGIEYRGFKQTTVEELAEYAGVPVWNGLTDEWHPTQMLADLLTIEEHFGYLKGLNFVYMGDARNNMANSLMVACAKMGVNYTACAPKELQTDEEIVKIATEISKENFSTVKVTDKVSEAVTGANVIYTDIWVSMGEPKEIWAERIKLLKDYQVNADVMKKADEQAIFLHCLPSFHDDKTTVGQDIAKEFGLVGLEVTDEVFESKQSKVFDEAENRMHTIKAVMYATLF
ncbi:ornithine carbamoyltransferase [Neofamilia massiliensis]|uniref:ornithine carbamoyltransferase n=1 Tax=Neofamilia massiliensis TaxID=1673724 RepID=UPI0006BB564B|nr:ornithine carbamoyltransferase [Neofamilia massiliensis]